MDNKKKPRSQGYNKPYSKSGSKQSSEIDNLLAFKRLKDQGNEQAIQIWEEFQSTKNDKKFQEDVAMILKYQSVPAQTHSDNQTQIQKKQESITKGQLSTILGVEVKLKSNTNTNTNAKEKNDSQDNYNDNVIVSSLDASNQSLKNLKSSLSSHDIISKEKKEEEERYQEYSDTQDHHIASLTESLSTMHIFNEFTSEYSSNSIPSSIDMYPSILLLHSDVNNQTMSSSPHFDSNFNFMNNLIPSNQSNSSSDSNHDNNSNNNNSQYNQMTSNVSDMKYLVPTLGSYSFNNVPPGYQYNGQQSYLPLFPPHAYMPYQPNINPNIYGSVYPNMQLNMLPNFGQNMSYSYDQNNSFQSNDNNSSDNNNSNSNSNNRNQLEERIMPMQEQPIFQPIVPNNGISSNRKPVHADVDVTVDMNISMNTDSSSTQNQSTNFPSFRQTDSFTSSSTEKDRSFLNMTKPVQLLSRKNDNKIMNGNDNSNNSISSTNDKLRSLAYGSPLVSGIEKIKNKDNQNLDSKVMLSNTKVSNIESNSKGTENTTTIDSPIAINRSHQFRTTRNQPGRLYTNLTISQNNRTHSNSQNNSNHIVGKVILRPNQGMTVYWELPQSMLQTLNTTNFGVGLTRYGSAVNSPCIITKLIGKPIDVQTDIETGIEYAKGKLPFYTPRSAGRYVYRLFDQTSPETARTTLATSTDYIVELDEPNLDYSLKFIKDLFTENSKKSKTDKINSLKAMTQLLTAIDGIRPISLGKGVNYSHRIQHIGKCLTMAIESVMEYSKLLDSAMITTTAMTMAGSTEQTQESSIENKNASTSSSKQIEGLGIAKKIHIEAYNLFQTLCRNKFLYDNIDYTLRESIVQLMNGYCILLQRFFESTESMEYARKISYGFIPAKPMSITTPKAIPIANPVIEKLNIAILSLIPSLIPDSNSFDNLRESIRVRIESYVIASGVVPIGTEVALYGSSKNNFGTVLADVDMCIVLPKDYHDSYRSSEEKGRLMDSIGKYLIAVGMTNVEIIATARIPVVNFTDPITGLECDVTYHNPLAIKNTLLLRAYSEIDPRVRIVAYIIKYWAKRRYINNPGDGTLSSYGFLLCFFHFLQIQSISILPNLQAIPMNWSGQAISSNNRDKLPVVYEVNVVDGSKCNAYFHQPTPKSLGILKTMAAKNLDSCALLLLKFFNYYAHTFDYMNDVISIRSGEPIQSVANVLPNSSLSSLYTKKLDKAESDGWILHERLSIEDPFEHWYDVAHVIKGTQMKYIRKEFLRAYTLIIRTLMMTEISDELPISTNPENLLSLICEQADPPPFSSVLKDQKKQGDSVEKTEDEDEDEIAVDLDS